MWSGLFLIDLGRYSYLVGGTCDGEGLLVLFSFVLLLLLLGGTTTIVVDMYPICWYSPRHIPQPKTLIPTYIPNHTCIYAPIHPIHALCFHTTPSQTEEKKKIT